MPFTRGGRAAGNRVADWDIRQTYAYPDPAKCNDIILHELARGVTSIHICFDAAAQAGLDPDQPGADKLAGSGGVMISSLDDLDRLLTGVHLDLVTVSLGAGAQFLAAAAMLDALWQRRGVAADAAKGAFNADPLGTLAVSGTLPADAAQLAKLALTADLARYTAATWPNVTALGVDTSAYHDAGATESQDLAISMATAVAYLKAMTGAGMSVDDACRQILFTYAVPCDQFLGICKLRAARKMWARVAEACGACEAGAGDAAARGHRLADDEQARSVGEHAAHHRRLLRGCRRRRGFDHRPAVRLGTRPCPTSWAGGSPATPTSSSPKNPTSPR